MKTSPTFSTRPHPLEVHLVLGAIPEIPLQQLQLLQPYL